MELDLSGLNSEVNGVLEMLDQDAAAGRPLRVEQGTVVILAVIGKALLYIAESVYQLKKR